MEISNDIYNEYADLIYKYLYRLTQNPVLSEELTQDTFYRAVITIHNFKGECKLSTWLCQIAKLSWYKYLEKESKNKHISIDNMPFEAEGSNNTEQTILDKDAKVILYKQVHKLKEPYREVVMLRILGDLSFGEIAEVFGKNENWARVTYHRAKILLTERSNEDADQL